MDRMNIFVTTEMELLSEMNSFLSDLEDGIYSDSDVLQLLIKIEQALGESPSNVKYLNRMKAWVRSKSRIEFNY